MVFVKGFFHWIRSEGSVVLRGTVFRPGQDRFANSQDRFAAWAGPFLSGQLSKRRLNGPGQDRFLSIDRSLSAPGHESLGGPGFQFRQAAESPF